MPSQDTYHKDHPEANRPLARQLSDEEARRLGIERPAQSAAEWRTARPVRSARVQALAASLAVDAEALAARIPEDTHRRLKYSVFETEEPDGTVSFKHDPQIVEGVKSLLATDRSYEDIGQNAPAPRGESGRFTK